MNTIDLILPVYNEEQESPVPPASDTRARYVSRPLSLKDAIPGDWRWSRHWNERSAAARAALRGRRKLSRLRRQFHQPREHSAEDTGFPDGSHCSFRYREWSSGTNDEDDPICEAAKYLGFLEQQ